MTGRVETIEDFIKRGGKIKYLRGHQANGYKKPKMRRARCYKKSSQN